MVWGCGLGLWFGVGGGMGFGALVFWIFFCLWVLFGVLRFGLFGWDLVGG